MTARGTWKASERGMAAALGGVRVPVTGRQRGAAPDIAHKLYAIEHKYGRRILSSRLHEAIEQAEAAAAHEFAETGVSKMPLVTIEEHLPGRRDNECFVLMRLCDFLELTSEDEG